MNENITIDILSKRDSVLGIILDSIFDGVYIVDKNRRIIFWNKGAEEITGYKSEEVMGKSCSDDILNHIDENGTLLCRDKCPLIKTIRTGKISQAKVYPLHKSGKRFPILTHISPIRNDDGEIIAGIEIFRDISLQENFRILQEKFNTLIKKYVSTTTFNEIMEQAKSGADSNAKLRDLTILYMDIVGFTTFSEKNSSEEVVRLLNDVFGMCEVITKECHGDIDKFIGDALMAVFIDANDAVNAAEKIIFNSLPAYNKLREEESKNAIKIRIGINSGNVIQGDIGTIERKDLTVIGDVVNTAERIESLCTPNSIFISESTFSRLKPENSGLFKFHENVSAKGKKESVPVFKYISISK